MNTIKFNHFSNSDASEFSISLNFSLNKFFEKESGREIWFSSENNFKISQGQNYELSNLDLLIARKLAKRINKKIEDRFTFTQSLSAGTETSQSHSESSSNCTFGEFWYNYSSIISPDKRGFCNVKIANNALKGYEWIIYFSTVFYTYAQSLANEACTFKVKISRTAPALSN